MGNAELLTSLREQIGSNQVQDREFWKAPLLSSGVPKGIIVELIGNAYTEWLLQFFKEHPENYIYWCERDSSVNPTAIYQRGINLERIKFVITGDELQQPLRLALESNSYPFLVAPSRFDDVKIFQRLHLLAEKSKSTLFFLGQNKFSQAWPISLQLEINFSSDGIKINVHRQKYGVNK